MSLAHVVVCWKWLGGPPALPLGVSAADESALELALRLAGDAGTVTVVSCAPPGAEMALRQALARGAGAAVRVESPGTDTAGVDVAEALTAAVFADGSDLVCCGDYSLDRGTGSVPAYLAAMLGWPQALGLLDVTPAPGHLVATRRLDQGRRERLDIRPPAVLSVEPSVAAPRRAPLAALRAARQATIEVLPGPRPTTGAASRVRPFRPRTRVVPAPGGHDALDRVRRLADTDTAAHATDVVTLEPPQAAAHLLHLLRQWGYVADR